MTNQFCLDANVFITAWNVSYRPQIFYSLWDHLSQNRDKIVLIKPVFDEIDPVSQSDKKLPLEENTL